ncbi:V-SRC [Fragariocoptes setiger]|uniref:Tyrosine-protein kinase n=1 Tax=Fragariocoptes setiger TaxID=1670756 RepID=A0ABQ7SB97_9ACAR|nr:V-SRC [Fragariocoptes setiger]
MGNCLANRAHPNHLPNRNELNHASFSSLTDNGHSKVGSFGSEHVASLGGQNRSGQTGGKNSYLLSKSTNNGSRQIPDLMTGDLPLSRQGLHDLHASQSQFVLHDNNNGRNQIIQCHNQSASIVQAGAEQQNIVIGLQDFSAKDARDLSFQKGDRLIVVESNDPDWWYAEHVTTKKVGFIPKNYVASHPIEMEDWFFSKITRREADKLLLTNDCGRGTFLVRNSEQTEGYSLSIRDWDASKGDHVKHYKIKTLDSGGFFVTTRVTFASMSELIAFYSQASNGLCHQLVKPCPKPNRTFWPDHGDEITRKDLKLIRKIGLGYFGEVFYGIYRDREVAVKTLKPGSMSPQAFLDEAVIMRKCRHENLVPLFGVCSREEPLLIITEFMCNGSLLSYLRNKRARDCKLSLIELTDIARQICNGMAYLEEQKLIHRDLAARNILVGRNLYVKVADFGLARMIGDSEYTARQGAKFPIKWTAPEAAIYNRFSIKSDVWSFGVLLWEVMTHGQVPYQGMQNREVIERVEKGYRMQIPKGCDCPDSVYLKMCQCWDADPEKRPTFKHLYNFFDDFEGNTIEVSFIKED